ncbi:hypothetical protein BN3662_00202 [Clostridiales bacterium CHKCI006]|nr:hypothetical protein BN3662_00202 [Clostridiales bacterium CHKCI006]
MKYSLEKGVNGMIWMSIITFFNFFIQLIITYFLARLLTPTDYGEMALITVLISFIAYYK